MKKIFRLYFICTVTTLWLLMPAMPNAVSGANGVAFAQSASRSPVYRFIIPRTGAHFFTASETEKQMIIDSYEGWYGYEGIAWYSYTEAGRPNQALPVYRFFNELSETHFFTISETEKAYIIANYDWYVYEGIAWYALPSDDTRPLDATPVYRFYAIDDDVHFYTASEAEKNTLMTQPHWNYRYEGIAWYAFLSDAPVEPSQWTVWNQVCCAYGGGITVDVTIDDALRRSTSYACADSATQPAFVATPAGPKTIAGRVYGDCVAETFQFSLSEEFDADTLYLLALEKEGPDLVVYIYYQRAATGPLLADPDAAIDREVVAVLAGAAAHMTDSF